MTTPLYRIVPGPELTRGERRSVIAMLCPRSCGTIKTLAFYFDYAGNYLGVFKDL